MPLRKVGLGEFYLRTEPSLQLRGMSEAALSILFDLPEMSELVFALCCH